MTAPLPSPPPELRCDMLAQTSLPAHSIFSEVLLPPPDVTLDFLLPIQLQHSFLYTLVPFIASRPTPPPSPSLVMVHPTMVPPLESFLPLCGPGGTLPASAPHCAPTPSCQGAARYSPHHPQVNITQNWTPPPLQSVATPSPPPVPGSTNLMFPKPVHPHPHMLL